MNLTASQKVELVFYALAMALVVGGCFFVLFKIYWLWYRKNIFQAKGPDATVKKPTLFDVRELLMKGQRDRALGVYQKIFKVGHKEACRAVEELEKNLHR